MKLITAIVKPEKLDELIQSVIDAGVRGLTVTDVRGFGRQFGQLTAAWHAAGVTTERQTALLPKIRLDIVVLDDDAETMIETIAKCANTGTIGDGKVWVTEVDSVLRVRTGERDRDAI
ncbi:MAG: P-II family nitrogen regulator [Micromonosporaceae bacterium]